MSLKVTGPAPYDDASFIVDDRFTFVYGAAATVRSERKESVGAN